MGSCCPCCIKNVSSEKKNEIQSNYYNYRNNSPQRTNDFEDFNNRFRNSNQEFNNIKSNEHFENFNYNSGFQNSNQQFNNIKSNQHFGYFNYNNQFQNSNKELNNIESNEYNTRTYILSNGQNKYTISVNENATVRQLISKLKLQYSKTTVNNIILIYKTTALDANKKISEYNIPNGKRIKFSEAYDGGY